MARALKISFVIKLRSSHVAHTRKYLVHNYGMANSIEIYRAVAEKWLPRHVEQPKRRRSVTVMRYTRNADL